MWKILIGFVIFAGVVVFALTKGGDIDMSGEKHGTRHALPAVMAA